MIEHETVDLEEHSVRIGVKLTATTVHLDTAVPTPNPDPSHDVESDAMRHLRNDSVSLLEAAAPLITADCLRLILPPTAELEDPTDLPGTAALATDAHKRQRYTLEFLRGGLPTFPPGQSRHTSFENDWR